MSKKKRSSSAKRRTPGSRSQSRSGGSGPHARKSLGQHFLRDTGVLADITTAVGPPLVPVVEIGPGTGQLTEFLLEAGHQVIAIEIEERMLRHLQRRFPDESRLTLVQGDAREVNPGAVVRPGTDFIVAGNLPYFAASYITRKVLESERQPLELVVMVQREVAREFAAEQKLSLLALGIQIYASPELLFDVQPEAFDPPPAVWSSVVKLTVRPEPQVPRDEIEGFFETVSRIFRQPRKQIHNALGLEREAASQALELADIERSRRPETLSIEEWLTLVRIMKRQALGL